jgi:hypothetical protein
VAKKAPAPKASSPAPVPAPEPIERPALTSPDWPDYVASLFAEGETDSDGNPFIHGLRRVTELAIGPIVKSVSKVVETPRESNGFRATVEHLVVIRFGDDDPREFGDAADVYSGNTDPDYAQYPVATAATRAEGRALRKALKLRKTAAEEISSVPAGEAGLDGFITLSQKKLIEKLCRELALDPAKLIAFGQFKYDNIAQVRYDSAKGMIEYLNKLFQDNDKIPAELKLSPVGEAA